MRYTLLGGSGLRVSELALGTMTFGEAWGWGASTDECRRIFEVFVDAGGNFVDTASNYTDGQSEEIVGALTGADRGRFVIATKYPPASTNTSKMRLHSSVDAPPPQASPNVIVPSANSETLSPLPPSSVYRMTLPPFS